MSASDYLLRKQKTHEKLYDVESMLEIKGSEATGYVILLGSPPSEKDASKTKEAPDLTLAFGAVTSGNVVDACFGVANPILKEDTPARRSAREAKILLEECDTSDAFREIAVKAYCEAFKVVVRHQAEMGKLNCITRCFRSTAIRNETMDDIRKTFDPLVIAVQESDAL
mmetsp:Transcript_9131/g.22198  ORF Transcript_9131/g.22198 Transcript_9131/m.22198 type:complete len:169 (+) Transcript_9131:298-804(+)